MRTKLFLAVASLAAAAIPIWAHHAFQAEFDQKKPVKLEGKVTNWMVECGSPNIMLRRGFTKRSLEAGTEISVAGYQAKNGDNKANGSSVTFKDGHKLFVGGSNPDDPNACQEKQQ